MKKRILVAACAGFAVAGCSRSSAYQKDQQYFHEDSDYAAARQGSATGRAEKFGQPKKKLYALAFANATPLGGDELGEFVTGELLRELRGAGRAVVPTDLRSADSSKDFFNVDRVRLGALSREGKRMGVALLIVGRIRKITYRSKGDEVGVFRQRKSIAAVDLELRMFDVVNSREILLDQKSADSSNSALNLFGGEESDPRNQRLELVQMALRNGAHMLAVDVARALEKISWEGRIAKVSGSRIYINAGRASGLNVGDILRVLTAGEDVYDPVTGSYMGKSPGQAKGTLEIVDYLGPDGSVAAVHSGGNFVENDIVQLY